jgi:hypothetical protein
VSTCLIAIGNERPLLCSAVRPTTRYALLALLFLGAYWITAATIRSLNPWSDAENLRTKLAVFDEHRDEYDALYLGSSHVYHSFQPEIIDPLIARTGTGRSEFRSFNLGMEGMFSFETDALLRKVLDEKPARLRWLIVEAPTWRPKLSKVEVDSVTERNARWHDPASTFYALRSIALAGRDSSERSEFASAGVHIQLFGLWLGNHGRAPAIWDKYRTGFTNEQRIAAASFLERRGYQALEQREGEIFELRQRNFLAKSNSFPERVAKMARLLDKRSREDLPMDAYNFAALARQVRAIERAGLEVVYVTLPALMVPRYFEQLSRDGHLPNYLDFRDPKRYPEFWTVEHRFDEGHLSEEGAVILSRIFADHFAALARDSASEVAR